MNIVLIGFMASGKTVVGKILAAKLNMKYIDVDETIEKNTGQAITDIFKKHGESVFRDMETKAIKCVALLDHFVIAVGGGAVMRAENVQELRSNGKLVYLSASPEAILRRIGDAKSRPLLAKEPDKLKKIKEMLAHREPIYKECDFRVDTTMLKIEQVADKIVEWHNHRVRKM
ncbi:MAG: shikimate kinase [bacterium]|nr:shikimate kinase [bacterium]MDD5354183.1 shikimate kinase [bacterium]MDD5756335.1 shikimate kinase [bacterium]